MEFPAKLVFVEELLVEADRTRARSGCAFWMRAAGLAVTLGIVSCAVLAEWAAV